MKKNLLLTLLLTFLVVMNAVLLFLLFRQPPRKIKPPHEFIVAELQLSPEQMKKYWALEEDFKRRMHPMHRQSRELKNSLFSTIFEDHNATKLDSLTSLIGKVEKLRDVEVYSHLSAVYALCDEDQKKRFQQILEDAMRRGPRGGPGPPRGP